MPRFEQTREGGSAQRAAPQRQDWQVGNGSKTVFFLLRTPIDADHLLVYVNGSLKRPAYKGTAYDYSWVDGSNKVTFAAAPANGNNVLFLTG